MYGNNTRYNFCFVENGIKYVNDVYAEDIINELKPRTVLDYGSGYGLASERLQSMFPDITFFNYEPFVPKFSNKPTGSFDLVICHKVLRAVEPEFRDSVLDEIYSLSSKYVALSLVIYTEDLIDLTYDDWKEKIFKYKHIIKHGVTTKFNAMTPDEVYRSLVHAGFLIKK